MSHNTMKAITLYWSSGGNTARVARSLHDTLEQADLTARLQEISPDLSINYYDYDLVLLGAPVYQFLPPEPVQDFLNAHQDSISDVRAACPEKPGHFGVVFCTYGGPHTGVREALPSLLYMGQFLEHAGIRVMDELPVVGEFHAEERQPLNTRGRLGDIRGRPNDSDLRAVSEQLRGILRRVQHKI
jgi:hypothetical protein